MTGGKTYGDVVAEKTSSTVTIMGVEGIEIMHEALEDFELVELAMVLNDNDADDADKTRALAAFGPAAFGAKEWKRIKAELRKQNGGKLTVSTAVMFIYTALIELGKLKNS